MVGDRVEPVEEDDVALAFGEVVCLDALGVVVEVEADPLLIICVPVCHGHEVEHFDGTALFNTGKRS